MRLRSTIFIRMLSTMASIIACCPRTTERANHWPFRTVCVLVPGCRIPGRLLDHNSTYGCSTPDGRLLPKWSELLGDLRIVVVRYQPDIAGRPVRHDRLADDGIDRHRTENTRI